MIHWCLVIWACVEAAHSTECTVENYSRHSQEAEEREESISVPLSPSVMVSVS